MYRSGSAILPSTDAMASLRQTSRLRRQTGNQRRDNSGMRSNAAEVMVRAAIDERGKYSAAHHPHQPAGTKRANAVQLRRNSREAFWVFIWDRVRHHVPTGALDSWRGVRPRPPSVQFETPDRTRIVYP
jgi:hypothetical protein